MPKLFLSIHGAIFIDQLLPREKFNSGCFCEKYSSRFSRSCTAGAVQVPQDRYCVLTMPQFIGQPLPKMVSRAANSDTLPNLPKAMVSVSVTSFYSVT
jgi:hypothetical protein